MIELKAELYAAPINEWIHVPFTANRHKWLLQWYRIGKEKFCFSFRSPNQRRYSFWAELGENGGGRVTEADIERANGETIADYCERWGDKPERMDAVLRLTPKHVLARLFMLLDAIG